MAAQDHTPTLVLDISRTVSRIGRGRPTGIDRVEIAYINHFLGYSKPVVFLARFGRHSAILNRRDMRNLLALIKNDGPWEKANIVDNLRHLKNRNDARIRKTIRQLSLADGTLGKLLQRNISSGFTYLNVGHGYLKPDLWQVLRTNGAKKIVVMVHDLIPIDFPQYTPPSSSKKFQTRMLAATQNADVLIYNSSDTRDRMQIRLKEWGCKQIVEHIVLLGTDPLPSSYANVGTNLKHPYFVCLGTIEPRKNHKLLLDIWANYWKNLPVEDTPHLHIVGARGWLNKEIFDTLDSAEFMGKTVLERGQLSDGELGILIAGSKALLFPSHAEGFGFPLVEALQLCVPVICSNLPCFHEIAGNAPMYIDAKNQKRWSAEILAASKANDRSEQLKKKLPTFQKWNVHFEQIDTILSDME